MSDFFLPYKVSPQGWLTDFLLAQIYNPKNKDLYDLILKDRGYSIKNNQTNLISINPNLKDDIEKKIITTLNNPTKNKVKDNKTRKEYVNFLLNMTPAQTAALTPFIRLYLKTTNKEKPTEKDWNVRDLIFKEYTDLDFILKEKYTRIGSAGIIDVGVLRKFPNWALGNDIEVDISFYFASWNTFFKGHPVDPSLNMNVHDYVELIKPGGMRYEGDTCNKNFVKESRLMLEYGWKFNKSTSDELVPRDIRETFEDEERKLFQINWRSHTFDVKQNGEINLQVRYTGVAQRAAHKAEAVKGDDGVLIVGNDEFLAKLMNSQNVKEAENLKNLVNDYKNLKDCLDAITGKRSKCPKKSTGTTGTAKKKCPCTDDEAASATAKRKELLTKINAIRKKLALKAVDQTIAALSKDEQLFNVKFHAEKVKNENPTKEDHKITVGINQASREAYAWARTSTVNIGEVSKLLEAKKKKLIYNGPELKAKLAKSAKPLTPEEKEEKKVLMMNKLMAALTNSGQKVPIEQGGYGHGKNTTFGNFNFFTVRELVRTIYERMENQPPLVCFGNMVVKSLGKELWVNIGDIPIEVNMFKKWFYTVITNPGITSMTFGKFIASLSEDLIPRALFDYAISEHGSSYYGSIQNSFHMVDSKLLKNKDTLDALYMYQEDQSSAKKNPPDKALETLAQAMKKTKAANSTPMIFLHQTALVTSRKTEVGIPALRDLVHRRFNRKEDEGEGLYHLIIGDSKGILTNVDFSYVDDDQLRSGLMLNQRPGSDSTRPFLKYTYSATPTMVGNNLFTKGAYFVIPRSPMGISAEEDPGIAGYYQVRQMRDNIGPGVYTTVVDGTNMHTGQKTATENRDTTKPNKEDEKLEKFEPYVSHTISDYYVQILDYEKTQKAYYLKIKDKEERCPPPPTFSKKKVGHKGKCEAQKGQRGKPWWNEKSWNYEEDKSMSRCQCKNGYWWRLSDSLCYCDRYQIVKSSGNWYEYEEKKAKNGTWKCVRKSNKPVKPKPTKTQHQQSDKLRIKHALKVQELKRAILKKKKPTP
jgi:hypothetical protein